MEYMKQSAVYELGRHFVLPAKNGYEVYENIGTHGVRRGGFFLKSGNLESAIAFCNKREEAVR